MSSRTVLLVSLVGAAAVAACTAEPAAPPADPDAALLGGETTVFEEGPIAYSLPARNLDGARRDTFSLGDHFFNRSWVAAPASASGNDGLGPTYNATSCSACHLHDGRSAPPAGPGDDGVGLLLRLSVPGTDEHGMPRPDPVYGGQLQPLAILGVPAEARVTVTWEEIAGAYPDGERYVLRSPRVTITDLAFGPLGEGAAVSPRVAPAMIGLGLLEAIPDATLEALADEADRDGDGISGRTNVVWDARERRERTGRFGWKANQPSIAQQTAGAFLGDLGITSSLFSEEGCPEPQAACRAAPTGGVPELSDQKLDAVTLYARTLAVPARRAAGDAAVRRGDELFAAIGCASCHTARLRTGPSDVPALAEQTIRPYTDLLLHDMGEGLADNRPDGRASGSEWRTPPLWGVGLLERVSKHATLLHDGRARGFAEAILWHGGEAQGVRDRFKALSAQDRAAVIAFLGAL